MKAISPVIATVIIVAVAIAISIAVALWITGLTSSFTGVEKLEIVNAYATADIDLNGNAYWNITLIIKNTGTKPATIDQIFINNKPGTITNAFTDGKPIPTTGKTLKPGDTKTITFILTSTGSSISDVENTTRQDGKSPYISLYPKLVLGAPSSQITIYVGISDGDAYTSYLIKIYDENNEEKKEFSVMTDENGNGLQNTDITLPEKIGYHTWTIEIPSSGDSVDFTIMVTNPIISNTFSSGQTVSIVIHTASGGQYPATITLP